MKNTFLLKCMVLPYLIGAVVGTIGRALNMSLPLMLLIGVVAACIFLYLWDCLIEVRR